jgi:putative ABC transport system permease protein
VSGGRRAGGGRLLPLRLLARRIIADRWVAAMVILLVAASTGLALGLLRHLDTVQHRAVRQAAEQLGPRARDLVATLSVGPVSGPASDPAHPYEALLDRVRRGPIATVGPIAGVPDWAVRTRPLTVLRRPRPVALSYLVLGVGSGWRERVHLVAGRFPTSARPARPPLPQRLGADPDVPARIEVALAADAARNLHLLVGDQVLVSGGATSQVPPLWLDLVGTYVATDTADPFWGPRPELLRGSSTVDNNLGTVWTGTALADVQALPVLQDELFLSASVLEVRIPVRPDQVGRSDPEQLLSRLRTAGAVPVDYPEVTQEGGRLLFVSQLDEALAGYLQQRVPTLALALLLMAGLGLAALVVLVLALRLLVDRRRTTLAVTAARGTSPGQALRQLAVEGFVLALPAVGLGVAAAALVPGRAGTGGTLVVGLGLLAPTTLLPAGAWPLIRLGGGGAVRRRRRRASPAASGGDGARDAARDGGRAVMAAGSRVWRPGGSRGAAALGQFRGAARQDAWSRRGRWLLEAGLIALAVGAVLALRARGLAASAVTVPAQGDPGSPASGVDPLVLVGPTLVGAVVALVVARLLGPVLAAGTRWAARRRGAVAFLGLARAAREGTVGVAGLVAVVLAMSTAALAAVTGATVSAGAADAARQAVGADLRVHGVGLNGPQSRRLSALPGVRQVVELTTVDPASVLPPGAPSDTEVTVLAAEPRALAGVQADLGRGALPRAVADRLAATAAVASGGELPVAVSPGLAVVGDRLTVTVLLRAVPARVVAVLPRLLGAPADAPWVLASLPALRQATQLTMAAQDVLVATAPGASPPTQERLRAVLGDVVTSRTPADQVAELASSPLVGAVQAGLPASLLVGAAYAAAAIWLGIAVGARSRSTFLAHLRALGLSTRQAGALLGLEVVPAVLAAAVAGPFAGALLAPVVLGAADLRPLTGSVLPPDVVLSPQRLAWLAVAVLLVTAVAAGVAVLAGRRVSPAAASRVLEGG